MLRAIVRLRTTVRRSKSCDCFPRFRLVSSTINLGIEITMLVMGAYPFMWDHAASLVPPTAEVCALRRHFLGLRVEPL